MILGIQVFSQEDHLDLELLQATNIEQITIFGSYEPNGQLAFNHEGTLLATIDPLDSEPIVLWNPYEPFRGSLAYFEIEILDPYSISFTPDDNFLAVGGMDGEIVIWDIEASRINQVVRGPNDYRVDNITFNEFNEQFVASYDGVGFFMLIWDEFDDTIPISYPVTRGAFALSALNPNLIATSRDQYVTFYNSEIDIFYAGARVHDRTFHTISFSDVRQQLLTSDAHNIRLWDLWELMPQELPDEILVVENPTPFLDIEILDTQLFEVDVIWRFNLIIAATLDKQLLFFDLQTGELLHTLEVDSFIRYIEVSPRGDIIAVSMAVGGTTLLGIPVEQ